MALSVRVYPDLGLSAIRIHKGGGFRIWTLARALDKEGRGWIYQANLYNLQKDNRVRRRTFFYWLKQARELGMFIDGERGKIFLLSLEKTAKIFYVSYLHSNFIMPARKLTGKGWRSFVFASMHTEKPCSRQTLKTITGISPRTQARYDAVAKVKRKPNIYVTDRPASDLPGACEYGKEATNFILYDPKTKTSKLAHKRPDSREPYGNPIILRSKWEVNKRLCSANSCNYSFLSSRQWANSVHVIFHDTQEKAENAASKNGRLDLAIDAFYLSRRTSKVNFYSLA
jgi:hypothetical protein